MSLRRYCIQTDHHLRTRVRRFDPEQHVAAVVVTITSPSRRLEKLSHLPTNIFTNPFQFALLIRTVLLKEVQTYVRHDIVEYFFIILLPFHHSSDFKCSRSNFHCDNKLLFLFMIWSLFVVPQCFCAP